MRKLICMVLLLVMLGSVTVLAAGPEVSLSSAKGNYGEVVYLKVRLENAPEADNIAVVVDYDKTVLEWVSIRCSWDLKGGTLSNFSAQYPHGVWSASSAKKVNGDVCTVALRLIGDAPDAGAEVSCKVRLLKENQEIGVYTGIGVVEDGCSHSFSKWQWLDGEQHVQICQHCDYSVTQSHQFDEGRVHVKPTVSQPGEKIFVCQTCEGVYKEQIPALGSSGDNENRPTQPQEQENPSQNEKPEDTCEHVFAQWTWLDEKLHQCKCIQCEYTVKETHTFESEQIIREATATEAGEALYICRDCNGAYRKQIPALGQQEGIRPEDQMTNPDDPDKQDGHVHQSDGDVSQEAGNIEQILGTEGYDHSDLPDGPEVEVDDPHAGHDHPPVQTDPDALYDGLIALGVLLAAMALFVGVGYFIRKKK